MGIESVGERAVENLGIDTIEKFWKFNDTKYINGQSLIAYRDSHKEEIEELLQYVEVVEEKKSVGTMYTIFGIVIIFWAIFKLNGTALTTYANSYTDREMSSTFLAPAKTLSQVDNSVIAKNDSVFQLDEHFRKIKDANGNPVKCVDYPSYFKN